MNKSIVNLKKLNGIPHLFFVSLLMTIFSGNLFATDTLKVSELKNKIQLSEIPNIKIASFKEEISFDQKIKLGFFKKYTQDYPLINRYHLIRFYLKNDYNHISHIYLNTSHNDRLTLYCFQNNQLQSKNYSGYLMSEKKLFLQPLKGINGAQLPPNSTCLLYLEWQSLMGYHQINNLTIFNEPILLKEINEIHETGILTYNFNIFFFGAIIFIFLFVFFLFYFNPHPIYFYYALYLFSVLLFALPSLKNTSILEDVFFLNTKFFYYLHEPTLFIFPLFYGVFILKLFEINPTNYPKIYRFIITTNTILFIYIIFLLIDIHFFDFAFREILYSTSRFYVQIVSLVLLFLLFYIESPYKKLIITGNLIFITLGIMAFIMDDILSIKLTLQGYRVNYFVLLKIGILSEILFFGMALGKRMYIIEKNKEHYFKHYIEQEEIKNKLQERINHLKIESLSAQFNPHFIFNCLNSIQYLILSNETEKASNFVTKFSNLIRKILDTIRSETISLQNELNLCKLYLEIEKERLNHIFVFSITISDDVFIENIIVPPLILQPFLENAIWHGLQPSKEMLKELSICINPLTKNKAEIIIFDNGIGVNGNIMAEKKSISHGMDITFERITSFNNINKYTINTCTISPFPPNGNGGTKIIITIQSNAKNEICNIR